MTIFGYIRASRHLQDGMDPFSQELQLREAGTDQRHVWHRLDGRMKDAGMSGRKIAQLLEVNEKTVRNALRAGGTGYRGHGHGPPGGTMTEMEMFKELRNVVAAAAGQAGGNREAVKAEIRAELVSTIKERFGGYLDRVKP